MTLVAPMELQSVPSACTVDSLEEGNFGQRRLRETRDNVAQLRSWWSLQNTPMAVCAIRSAASTAAVVGLSPPLQESRARGGVQLEHERAATEQSSAH